MSPAGLATSIESLVVKPLVSVTRIAQPAETCIPPEVHRAVVEQYLYTHQAYEELGHQYYALGTWFGVLLPAMAVAVLVLGYKLFQAHKQPRRPAAAIHGSGSDHELAAYGDGRHRERRATEAETEAGSRTDLPKYTSQSGPSTPREARLH